LGELWSEINHVIGNRNLQGSLVRSHSEVRPVAYYSDIDVRRLSLLCRRWI